MVLSAFRKEQFIEQNKQEYGDLYSALRFVTEARAHEVDAERRRLLARLGRAVELGCHGSKLDCRALSPGCQACTRGEWSCLFINTACNCQCFYCPSEQDGCLEPGTNQVPFDRPVDYVDYIRAFDFKGVSFSGGEPLLTLDNTLRYLRAVKDAFGGDVHTWLYTNGALATEETLRRLKEAGLDEIRVDIGARNYALDAVRRAVGLFNVVTVEVPAVPEEFARMQQCMREMDALGLSHLNLHQLRLTPYNYPHMVERDYTYLHGQFVSVLESETTALKLIEWGLESGLRLPVNYCSFVYKNRFQQAANRRRSARRLLRPWESLTEKGYIRGIFVPGYLSTLDALKRGLLGKGVPENMLSIGPRKDRLYLGPEALSHLGPSSEVPAVEYAEARIAPAVSYRYYFVEVPLNADRSLYVEKARVFETAPLDREALDALEKIGSGGRAAFVLEGDGPWEAMQHYEQMEEGFADYF